MLLTITPILQSGAEMMPRRLMLRSALPRHAVDAAITPLNTLSSLLRDGHRHALLYADTISAAPMLMFATPPCCCDTTLLYATRARRYDARHDTLRLRAATPLFRCRFYALYDAASLRADVMLSYDAAAYCFRAAMLSLPPAVFFARYAATLFDMIAFSLFRCCLIYAISPLDIFISPLLPLITLR